MNRAERLAALTLRLLPASARHLAPAVLADLIRRGRLRHSMVAEVRELSGIVTLVGAEWVATVRDAGSYAVVSLHRALGRAAVRLRRHPSSALTLAIVIGVSGALLGTVAALASASPEWLGRIEFPHRAVAIATRGLDPTDQRAGLSVPELAEVAGRAGIDAVVGFAPRNATIAHEDRNVVRPAVGVWGDLTAIVGGPPGWGAWPNAPGPTSGPEVVLSLPLAAALFLDPRDAIGATLEVDGHTTTIRGVFAPDEALPGPFRPDVIVTEPDGPRYQHHIWTLASLSPELTIAEFDADLVRLAREQRQAFPERYRESWRYETWRPSTVGRRWRTPLRRALAGSAGACVLALLVVALVRRADALRTSRDSRTARVLGASRGQLRLDAGVRWLFVSIGALAIGAGVAGIAIGPALDHFGTTRPEVSALQANRLVLVHVLIVTVLAAASILVLDEWWTRRDRSSGRRLLGGPQPLLAAGAALSVLLLASGIGELRRWTDTVRDANRLSVAYVRTLMPAGTTGEQRSETAASLLAAAATAVTADVGAADNPPISWPLPWGTIDVHPASSDGTLSAAWLGATPGFLGTIGGTVLEGRYFKPDEVGPTARVAVVDSILAARAWPGQSAVGKRVALRWEDDAPRWRRVVGVVRPLPLSANQPDMGLLHVPLGATESPWLVVYAPGGPAVAERLVDIVRGVGADPGGSTLSADLTDRVAGLELAAYLSGVQGLLSCLLGAIAGVMCFHLEFSRRRPRLAIELALGRPAHRARSAFVANVLITALGGSILAALAASALPANIHPGWPALTLAAGTQLIAIIATLLTTAQRYVRGELARESLGAC